MNFIFDRSLVLYLPLYELDGASFMSRDAYGHSCNVIGASWRPYGREFDGTDDYLDFPNKLPTQYNTITFTAWIRHSWQAGDSSEYVVSSEAKTVSQGLVLALRSFTDGMYLNRKAANQPLYNLPSANEWVHITVTAIDFNTAPKLYYNVLLQTNNGGSNYGTPDNERIGTRSAGDNFKGDIGEVWIYNRVLTLLEIQHNYLATKWRYR